MEVVDWKRYPPSYFSKCASSTLKKNIYKSNTNCSLSRRINNQRTRAFFSNVQHFPLHLQNKNQQKIIILSKTKQRSKKKEILGSFPLHGTLSSPFFPLLFTRGSENSSNGGIYYSPWTEGCVHHPPPFFYDVFTHGNLPSLARSSSSLSRAFSFSSILYPSLPIPQKE